MSSLKECEGAWDTQNLMQSKVIGFIACVFIRTQINQSFWTDFCAGLLLASNPKMPEGVLDLESQFWPGTCNLFLCRENSKLLYKTEDKWNQFINKSTPTHSIFPGRLFPLGLAFVQQCSAFLGLKKNPCTWHLWPFGKIYPSQQARSPALLPALLSQNQQQPLLAPTKTAFTPGLLAGSEQEPPSCQAPRSWHGGHIHKIHQVFGRSTHISENMDIRQCPLTKCFSPFPSILSKRTECPGHSRDTQRSSVQRCSKAQRERWAGSCSCLDTDFLP